MNLLRLGATLRRYPSGIMLGLQIFGILAYPFIENTPVGHAGFNAFGIAMLVVTTRMVRRTPFLTSVSMGVGLPAIVLLGLQAWSERPELLPWSAALEAIFYFYAAGSLTAYVLGDRHATVDELLCAGGTFTLIAWGFTYLFLLAQALQPHSFGAAVNPTADRSWTELMYLSFALLSSTGIGDIVPLTPPTRALASIEMFVGVMYLATVVSRLVAMAVQER